MQNRFYNSMKFEKNPLNPYIALALSQVSKGPFTVNDLVLHLPAIERFSGQRKAWHFVYQQIRKLVNGSYLIKRRCYGISRYEYLRTPELEQLYLPTKMTTQPSVTSLTPSMSRELLAKRLEGKKARYEEELEYLTGERDVITELLPEYPDIESEIRHIFTELDKKTCRLRVKISAIDRIISGVSL